MTNNITIEKHEGVYVLRDDLLPGGTKSIVLPDLLNPAYNEYVYASPVYGGFQIALSLYCEKIGKKATIFCAKRKDWHPNTYRCAAAGAKIIEVDVGYLSVVQKRAKEYVAEQSLQNIGGSQYIPFGANTAMSRQSLIYRVHKVIQSLGFVPDEIWCAVGSGLLFESILEATESIKVSPRKKIQVCGVVVGKHYSTSHPRGHLFTYPLSFEYETKVECPFPSMPNYDRKAWEVMLTRKVGKNILFWNVL